MTLPCFLLLSGLTATAAEPYTKTDYMIPMRDGIRLHTELWRPSTSRA